MSNPTDKLQLYTIRNAAKCGAYAFFMTLAMGTGHSWAYTDGGPSYDAWNSSPRYYRSDIGLAPRYCVPANGAQILGGFAGPSDMIDPVTGDVCSR
jgi:hypothetical protein